MTSRPPVGTPEYQAWLSEPGNVRIVLAELRERGIVPSMTVEEFQQMRADAHRDNEPAASDQRPIPVTNQISSFIHCRKCVQSIPSGHSPSSWAQLEIGFTAIGLQVWCRRHELNVCHIDFQGQCHPASLLCEEVP